MGKDFSLNDNISVLEANKRESFDGMRAYHESERSHLQNALQMMWKSTLIVVVVPNATLLIKQDLDFQVVFFSSILTLVIASAIILTIYRSAKEKIIADHSTYNMYGQDYAKTCELLHFLEPVELNNKSIKIKGWEDGKGPGSGKGFEHTLKVVRHTAYAFISIPILFCFIILINHFIPSILLLSS
jgi:hypothetical protein